MNRVNEKELKQYFRQIKLLLPVYRRKEKSFIKDLKNAVEEFIRATPDCSLEDITARFESPEDVVANYIAALDIEYLSKQILIRRLVKRTIISVVILCLLAFCAHMGMIYKLYLETKAQIVTQEVTVIE